MINGLTVRYGHAVAVDAVDLTVGAGELFVLLGASGSGKSTLLRAIAGFVQPDAGRVTLDGTDLLSLPPHRRPVNTMFQSYALFPHMSVAANIGFGLRMHGLKRTAREARVAEMLELVRLQGFGARRPGELSGGQQQRVALARSLAPHPSLLLLDEPLSALDRNLRRDTREELVRLQRALGIGFILVTHDQEEALTMADRIAVMHEGRLLQVGAPAEVYEQPTTRLVAEFLGAANVLPITVRDGRVALADGTTVRTAAAVPHDARWLAIRPERMMIGAPGAANCLRGVVTERFYAGDTLTHVVRVAGDSEIRATATLRRGVKDDRKRIGEHVMLSWDAEACIVLSR